MPHATVQTVDALAGNDARRKKLAAAFWCFGCEIRAAQETRSAAAALLTKTVADEHRAIDAEPGVVCQAGNVLAFYKVKFERGHALLNLQKADAAMSAAKVALMQEIVDAAGAGATVVWTRALINRTVCRVTIEGSTQFYDFNVDVGE